MKSKLIIIGAGGHGKVVTEIAKKNGYNNISFLDDDIGVKKNLDYPVVGTLQDIDDYSHCDFFIAIGDATIRRKLFLKLKQKGFSIITLIHPSAIISSNCEIGEGTVLMAATVLTNNCKIGKGCIINTASSVDHDSVIGDFVHISIGARIAGNVFICENTVLGAGSVVINNIRIESKCIIGAGAVVIKDIKKNGTYIGVPAKKLVM